jgi:DNA-binding response OmpR family regulator
MEVVIMIQKTDTMLKLPKFLISGDLKIDILNHHVILKETEVTLTPKAFVVLKHLMLGTNEIVSRDQLLEMVWGWELIENSNSRVVDLRIAELRRKLKCSAKKPRFIETVLGRGYRFILHVEIL